MEKREPYASQEEYDKQVIRYADVPTIELAPGIKAHIISAEKITLSMASGEPNAQLPSHRHESEQMLIVMDGAIDLVVEVECTPMIGQIGLGESGGVTPYPSRC
ncbi:MAG: hypothetical protein KKD83_08770 [Chloroflexi bacterium]|nr:hypothetical protein [Chloroflexota bacterium]